MSEETIICEDCTKDAGVTIYAVDRAEECVLCKLEALEEAMQRIYDNCSDTDLIIDIAAAALKGEK